MAGSKSDFLEAAILNHILGGSTGGEAYTAPANVFIALFTDSNTAAQRDAGTVTEVSTSGTGYGRVSVANTTAQWAHVTAAATNTKTNANAINFNAATTSWGTITAFGIYDATTAGNLLFWGDLSASKLVGAGDTVSFAAGAITVTED